MHRLGISKKILGHSAAPAAFPQISSSQSGAVEYFETIVHIQEFGQSSSLRSVQDSRHKSRKDGSISVNQQHSQSEAVKYFEIPYVTTRS